MANNRVDLWTLEHLASYPWIEIQENLDELWKSFCDGTWRVKMLCWNTRKWTYFALLSCLAKIRLELLQSDAPIEFMMMSAWTLLQMDFNELHTAWNDGSWQMRMERSLELQRSAYFAFMTSMAWARRDFEQALALIPVSPVQMVPTAPIQVTPTEIAPGIATETGFPPNQNFNSAFTQHNCDEVAMTELADSSGRADAPILYSLLTMTSTTTTTTTTMTTTTCISTTTTSTLITGNSITSISSTDTTKTTTTTTTKTTATMSAATEHSFYQDENAVVFPVDLSKKRNGAQKIKSEPLEDEDGSESRTLVIVSPSPPPLLVSQRFSAAVDSYRESTTKPILGVTSTPLGSSTSSPNFAEISSISANSSPRIPTSGFTTPPNGSSTMNNLPHRLEVALSLGSSRSSSPGPSLFCAEPFFVAESSSLELPETSPSPPYTAEVTYRSHVPSFPTETPRSPSPEPSTSRGVVSMTPPRSPSPELAAPLANLVSESRRSSAVRFSAAEVAKLAQNKLFSPVVLLQRYSPPCYNTVGGRNDKTTDEHVTIKLERSINIGEDDFADEYITTDNGSITADNEYTTAANQAITAQNESMTAANVHIVAQNESMTAANEQATAENQNAVAENAENWAPNGQLLIIRSRASTRSRRDHPWNLLRKRELKKSEMSISHWGNPVKKRSAGRPKVAKKLKEWNKKLVV